MSKVGFFLYSKIHSRPDTASSRIRGEWLINHWPEAEEFKYSTKYDAVIIQKAFIYDYAKYYDGVKILDMCDPDHDHESITEMMQYCDAMVTSTQALADLYSQITDKPVVVIPDRHDLSYFREKKIHRGKAKEMVWYGFSHNAHVLKSVRPILRKYELGISIIANQPVTISEKELGYTIKERYTKWEVNTVNKEIIKSDFTVIPGSRDPNFRFKSNNRTINSYLLKMPVAICEEDVERFLDPVERQKEADKNYEYAVKNFDIKLSVQEMKELIEKLRNKK